MCGELRNRDTSDAVRLPFSNLKHDRVLLARSRFDGVAGFANEIGNIDLHQRIGAFHRQKVASVKLGQGLAGAQGRQGALESPEIDGRVGHRVSLSFPGGHDQSIRAT